MKFIYVLRLAAKNLSRSRMRSLFVLGLIAVTSAIIITSDRYARAVMILWQEGTIDTGSGHFQLHHRDFAIQNDTIDPLLTLNEGDEAEVAKSPGVEALVRRLKFEGLIVSDSGSTYVLANATEPAAERRVSPLLYNPPYDQGEFVDPKRLESIVIGQGLAETLGVKMGDEVTVLSQTADGSTNAMDMQVDGIIDVPLPSFSKHTAYMNLAAAQQLTRMPNRYNEAAVRLKDGATLQSWVSNWKSDQIRMSPWWEIEPLVHKVDLIWKSVARLLSILLMLSAVLTLINIIFMVLNERLTEIGTLMAVGIRRRWIAAIFAFEGGLIAGIGGVIGALLGSIIVGMMGRVGIAFESPFGSGIEMVYPTVDWGFNLFVMLAAVCIGMICSIPPAWRAASLEPVVAYRGQA